MTRTIWIVVGAVGGVIAYRQATRTAQRARELGPVGSARVVANTTSRLAGRTANGLGRLEEARARRQGRLLPGTVVEVTGAPPPPDWVPAPSPATRPELTTNGRR